MASGDGPTLDANAFQEFKRRTSLRQIEIIVMVRRTGSISLAAEALSMSAANVTRTCQRFESNMGLPIFEKKRRGIRLTRLGDLMISELDIVNHAILEVEKRVMVKDTTPGVTE